MLALSTWFGALVPKCHNKDFGISLYSKLGGCFLGVVHEQRHDESREAFTRRLQQVGASLMPHECHLTWRCMTLEVLEPNKASLAWDIEEARRIAHVTHKPHYDPSYQGLRIDVDTHLAPEVAIYKATTLYIEGQLEKSNFADMSALARLELKVLEVDRGYFDMTDLPSLTRLDVSNAVLKRSMRLPKSLTQLLLRNVDLVSNVLNDIKSLGMLEVLELQSMKLKGGFPNELLGLELFILHLQGNNLDGGIPLPGTYGFDLA